jgi:superfamily II DNA or RNA helicase
MQLRGYQQKLQDDTYAAWSQGHKNVCVVLPTGGGKTRTFANTIHKHNGASVAIAHRQELVSQISLALNYEEVPHRIIGPKNVVKFCCDIHYQECGKSFYNPSASCAVAGVDTLIRRGDSLRDWCKSVTLWVTDECHHICKNDANTYNKWGQATLMFPNAKGLGVTATPLRADGKGLGRHHDGVFDHMIIGPSMRDLINDGFLTEYRIFAPPNDIDLHDVTISAATGDYSKTKLTTAVRKSHIVGDVVGHYKRIASGKLGVTFATDVETATEIAKQFNEAGVPAEVVSAKTPDRERTAIIRRFRNRELMQLVNVDLFGEGFDLPAIEVVSMARPTQSYGLYVQQFGRGLRLLDGKTHAIIIDHVGNVMRHGLPDSPREWTLDRRDKRGSSQPDDVIPVKTCVMCTAVFERIYRQCPECGHENEPAGRSSPEQVDGDLIELDAATLAQMRGEIEIANRTPAQVAAELQAKHAPEIGIRAAMKRQTERLQVNHALREALAHWCGSRRSQGMDDSEVYKRFYFKYGTDVLTAQTLPTKQAMALAEKVWSDL